MSRFNLTGSHIIVFFVLQCLDLAFGKNHVLFGHLDLKGLETVFKARQIVSQPHTANTAGRDKNTALSKLVTGPSLPMGRLLDGISYHCGFGLLIDSVFLVGFATVLDHKGVVTALLNGFALAVKGIA